MVIQQIDILAAQAMFKTMRDIAKQTKAQWKPALLALQQEWDATQDFSIYGTKEYLAVTDDCFVNWTSESLARTIQMLHNINYVPNTICDVYGGPGYAVAVLAAAFPTTQVMLYQPVESQAQIAEQLFKKHNLLNAKVITSPVTADVMLAFEVLEHIKQPHTLFIDAKFLGAKLIVTQATFTQDAPGHYTEYIDSNNEVCNRKRTAHKTYKWLDTQGYTLMSSPKRHIHPKFFNRTPNIRVLNAWQPPTLVAPLHEREFMKCFAFK